LIQYSGTYLNGSQFDIENSAAYWITVLEETTLEIPNQETCEAIELLENLNLVGIPCAPEGLSAFDLLDIFGGAEFVSTIQYFDTRTGQMSFAAFSDGEKVGDDFNVLPTTGLQVSMLQPQVIADFSARPISLNISSH